MVLDESNGALEVEGGSLKMRRSTAIHYTFDDLKKSCKIYNSGCDCIPVFLDPTDNFDFQETLGHLGLPFSEKKNSSAEHGIPGNLY